MSTLHDPASPTSQAPSEALNDEALVAAALAEDLGLQAFEPGDAVARSHDVTTRLALGGQASPQAEATITAKAAGRLSGVRLAAAVFLQVDPGIRVETILSDGDEVAPGDRVLVARGSADALLIAERTSLNFLGRLSGVATCTAWFVDAVAGSKAVVVDTRKTTPGWRRLEKQAVRDGGGHNHRMGLHDEVLLKENHFAMAGASSYLDVVAQVRAAGGSDLRVTAESRDLAEARAAADGGADVILLDNMTPAQLGDVVSALSSHPRRRAFELEASGGVELANVGVVAASGVDRISIGALTHSAPSLDLSLHLSLEGLA